MEKTDKELADELRSKFAEVVYLKKELSKRGFMVTIINRISYNSFWSLFPALFLHTDPDSYTIEIEKMETKHIRI